MSCFCKELPGQKRKKAQKQAVIPRLATANVIKRVDRSLELAGKSTGLQYYCNWERLVEAGVWEGVQTGKFDTDKLAAMSQLSAPAVLVHVTDQEQTQVSAGMYMVDPHGLKLTAVHMFDFFHRVWNCLGTATARSGLTPAFYAATMIFDLGYGPWETCAWWALMLAEASDMAAHMKADDPLLLSFWPRILVDKRLHLSNRDEDVGRAARERHLQDLAARGPMDIKNVKCKPSIWMSFHGAFDAWDSNINTRGMILASLSVHKRWITSHKQLFGDSQDGSGRSSSFGAAAKHETASKAAAVKEAKQKLAQLVKSAGHAVVAVAKLIASEPEAIDAIRMLAHGSRGVYTRESQRCTP